ncbi:hypothetical protein ACIG3E_32490 [Streptomyces sp. NPDC053474]|uniref:hypothetical protein n=1 Tax=Streptomyces sp. NPDC053474 TaxID=3365704 RepID=UPI0037D621AD
MALAPAVRVGPLWARWPRRVLKAAGGTGKYTELLRELGPRVVRGEPAHVEPARRLAAQLLAGLGVGGEEAACRVDEAVAWAVKDHELKHALLRTQGGFAAPAGLRSAVVEHAADEAMVHDAPLVQAVYMALEAAAG